MEKFWTLTRLNRNGSGIPVWAGKKGGVKYHSEASAIKRATEMIDQYGENIFVNVSTAMVEDFVMAFEPIPPPPPIRGFKITELHAAVQPEVGI